MSKKGPKSDLSAMELDNYPLQTNQALTPYKPPWLDREKIKAANISAGILKFILRNCKKIADSVRRHTLNVIESGKDAEKSLIRQEKFSLAERICHHTRVAIYKTLISARNFGRNIRLIDKVNLQTAPRLLDDDDTDQDLKRDIVADLDSRIALRAPLIEVIETIGRTCFDMGIPPERLIDFLESEDVLELLINEVLNLKHSRYSGENWKAIVGTSLSASISKLEVYSTSKKKRPVDETLATELKRKIAYFREHYDPQDKNHTVAKFIKALESEYPEYNLIPWLKRNKSSLIAIFKGEEDQRHIADMVNKIYEDRGQLNPRQFIDLNLDQFFTEYDSYDITNIPAFIRKLAGIDEENDKKTTICLIDMDTLSKFFQLKLANLQNKTTNLLQLRRELIEACTAQINTIIGNDIVVLFQYPSGLTKSENHGPNKEKIIEELTTKITETCEVVSSHVDVRNLLYDPTGIPPEMRQNLQDWFDDEGNLQQDQYRRFLRGIFGHTTVTKEGEAKDEQLPKLKKRATEIFKSVNEYLTFVSADLGIPPITMTSVQEVNDYAELIKIVCTTQDPRERFAARRKLELAALMYTCMIAPRYVYQDYEAKRVKEALEHSKRGIDYLSDENSQIWFIDDPKAQLKEISVEDLVKLPNKTLVKSIDLIPIKFGGEVKCHLIPTSTDDPFEYMSHKSLFSMLINLLNEDNKRAKDMTDLLRMTFVVDSVDELITLQKYLETNYISFGRSLKREDRYGHLVEVGAFNVSKNEAKSEQYRAVRYVVDIPVPDQFDHNKVYAVPVEIRILLKEDLIKERSTHHPASHRQYEDRRLKQIVDEKLAPEAIYPEIYKQEGPDPEDIFGINRMIVKDRRDYPKAA